VRNETDAVTARDLGDEAESADAVEAVSPYPDEPDGVVDAFVEPASSVYPDQNGATAASHAVPAAPTHGVDRSRIPDDDLFDGEPDEYELGFGSDLAPHDGPVHGDVLVFDEPSVVEAYQPRPMSRAERRRRVRLQARRVRRIIRHVEPWSVLKISLFFYACLWVILLVAGFMIWGVADSSGTIDRLESLFVDLFSLDEFTIDAGQVFRGYALAGLALAIAGTTFNVLMCLLFNLISDLTGGLRITMIEEETARPAPPRRVRRRRPPVRR
jgi:hypothetical protein